MSQKTAKALRITAIVLMGLTAVFTMLAGVGTACVAWNADKYGKLYAGFVPYMPVFQGLVFVTVFAAMVGIVAAYALARGDRWSLRVSIIMLVVSLIASAVQMYYSSSIRAVSFFATPPTNVRFYITLVTLIVLAVLGLPAMRDKVRLGQPGQGSNAAGGLTAFMGGILFMSTPMWAGPSHMLDGNNLVLLVQGPLMLGGAAMSVAGLVSLAASAFGMGRQDIGAAVRRLVSRPS